VVREVTAHFRARYEVNDIDGVRILFPEGWGLVRASNTQPALVMRFEATSPQLLKQYQEEVEKVVAAAKQTAASAI
jgi:phosphomannomutase/phosphoglucomutase